MLTLNFRLNLALRWGVMGLVGLVGCASAALAQTSAPAADPAAPVDAVAQPTAPQAVAPSPLQTTPLATPIVDAREAWRKRDAARLASLKASVASQSHPLASWVDYWELNQRLGTASVDELEAFYTRWKGRYVEDRLRNDWLLELGKRRDWNNFARDHARFRMNDDREVTCFALLAQHHAGKPVKAAALEAWLEQREADDGCHLLAQTLLDANVFTQEDAWAKLRMAVDLGRMRSARMAATLVSSSVADHVAEIANNPTRWLNTKAGTDTTERGQHLLALAIARLASADPELASSVLRARWQPKLSKALAAWTWAQVGEQASQKLLTAPAMDAYDTAFALNDAAGSKAALSLSEENLAWAARAGLRADGTTRWAMVQRAIAMMRPAQSQDTSWRYWMARALHELAPKGLDGDAQRATAQQQLRALSGDLSFYGTLATEDLGQRVALPVRPTPVTLAELRHAQQHLGLQSALAMISGGLRDEGVREWNYSLRGMDDRQLLAAAQWACERQVWDRCINTSERTRSVVDVQQRYPTPYKQELTTRAQSMGLDAPYVYGLIRQESRFIVDARSHVGAAGLMQLMPATARWTAQRVGMRYNAEQVTDPGVNITLGTYYLKSVLDDFGGSQAMAAAAYNAGPSRPRRWREGSTVEAAAWAESIPFAETRDYVKKVLSNAVIYQAMLGDASASLKSRLGATIGPRETSEPSPNRQLP